MIDYGRGYSCTWRLMRVDPETWADLDEVAGLLSASVEKDATSDLIESGSAEVDSAIAEGEFWGRLEMLAEQSGEVERHAVATLLMTPGSSTVGKSGARRGCDGRSVLSPAGDRVLLAGTYAPRGADGAAYAGGLISKCTPAPVYVDGSFTLSDNVVFAQGTTHAEAARMLLDAAGWHIRITGDGEVTVCPKPTDPALVLDIAAEGMLGTTVGREGSMADVPNRYIAVDGERSAVAVNGSAGDPSSFASRGRYVDVYDESPQLVDGESLEMYAKRKLAEASESLGTVAYEREWQPGVYPGDLVRGSIASVGLDCDMRVVSQSVEVGSGAKVTEKSEVLK